MHARRVLLFTAQEISVTDPVGTTVGDGELIDRFVDEPAHQLHSFHGRLEQDSAALKGAIRLRVAQPVADLLRRI